MWGIGPITQGFTAVAIFQLQEAGKLDVADTIDKHLPDLPAAWGKTTILELLQHASGIADFRSARGYDANRSYRPAALLALVAATPPLFKAGTQVRLSATNFVLLGMIIERTSGVSYREFVTRQQIGPLGLRATMFVEDFSTRSFADRPAPGGAGKQHSRFKAEVPFVNPVEPATGYRLTGGALAAVDAGSTVNLFAFGALWSSAEDISLWDIALAGGILVKKEENRALIYQPTKLANGTVVAAMAGWEFTRHPGFMEIKGSAPGFSAYLSRFTAPADLVCVTLLANREGLDLTGLAREIAESYKAGLGAGATSDDVVTLESKFSVDETVARLEARLRALNIPVFAQFDHAENARQAGMQLRPTKVLVFGNPKVGTRRSPSTCRCACRCGRTSAAARGLATVLSTGWRRRPASPTRPLSSRWRAHWQASSHARSTSTATDRRLLLRQRVERGLVVARRCRRQPAETLVANDSQCPRRPRHQFPVRALTSPGKRFPIPVGRHV
jgi:CubicO group peptidase (beta-lactamase class C family)